MKLAKHRHRCILCGRPAKKVGYLRVVYVDGSTESLTVHVCLRHYKPHDLKNVEDMLIQAKAAKSRRIFTNVN